MFGKIKDMASNSMIQKVVDQVSPLINEHIEKIKSLKSEQIYDNPFFDSMVSKPAWLAVSASLGGMTKLYPTLEQKFTLIMRHIRDELVRVNEGTVTLVENFQSKLPTVILEGLKKEEA